MKRKIGFYWVKTLLGNWEIAEWTVVESWFLTGNDSPFEDSDLQEIDENPIIRGM